MNTCAELMVVAATLAGLTMFSIAGKAFDIAVYTTQGMVRLTGMLDNRNQVDEAFTVTRAGAGVHSSHDELNLKR
jgi:osmotically-inducible protein OsmY